jgi:hypothetical protein
MWSYMSLWWLLLVRQWLVASFLRFFSTNKADRHDITEILLKVEIPELDKISFHVLVACLIVTCGLFLNKKDYILLCRLVHQWGRCLKCTTLCDEVCSRLWKFESPDWYFSEIPRPTVIYLFKKDYILLCRLVHQWGRCLNIWMVRIQWTCIGHHLSACPRL